ncbi:MAG: hypothetical protein VKP62_10250 [Candidatus Sericytochromatia bacterium]|nr:hypothetical protein [Candidatus Sericytochromatia bacterium]
MSLVQTWLRPALEQQLRRVEQRLAPSRQLVPTLAGDTLHLAGGQPLHAPTQRALRDSAIGSRAMAQAEADGAMFLGNPRDKTYFKELAEEFGFAGLPTVESKQALDEAVKRGERELFRGVHGPDAYAEQFRSGPLHDAARGTSVYGSGTYVAYGPRAVDVADHFRKGQGQILRMTLKADARVVKIEELVRMREAEAASLPRFLLSDYGLYGIHKGFDAIDLPQQGYMAILNRTAVRVQDVPHVKPFVPPGMRPPQHP